MVFAQIISKQMKYTFYSRDVLSIRNFNSVQYALLRETKRNVKFDLINESAQYEIATIIK